MSQSTTSNRSSTTVKERLLEWKRSYTIGTVVIAAAVVVMLVLAFGIPVWSHGKGRNGTGGSYNWQSTENQWTTVYDFAGVAAGTAITNTLHDYWFTNAWSGASFSVGSAGGKSVGVFNISASGTFIGAFLNIAQASNVDKPKMALAFQMESMADWGQFQFYALASVNSVNSQGIAYAEARVFPYTPSGCFFIIFDQTTMITVHFGDLLLLTCAVDGASHVWSYSANGNASTSLASTQNDGDIAVGAVSHQIVSETLAGQLPQLVNVEYLGTNWASD